MTISQSTAVATLSRTASLSLAGLVFAGTVSAQVVPWRTQISASPDAETLPQDRGADGLAQTLKKLDTWGSLMLIVAHPDDEDGGMLTLLSRGLGDRTALLTLNRGEGGQNAMDSESDDALGLIRTNELLAADQYSGSEQYFTRVADYGFSKTIEEAHEKWGEERVLYDVVRAIRLYRPMIVASVFVGGITDGHGHHQVAGEMAQKAFLAAGDPNVFPDQIARGLQPWSPFKVYARVPSYSISSKGMFDYATGKWAPARFYNYVSRQWSDQVPSADVTIPEGQWDPILGESYLQMARAGWSEQKSQFGGGYTPLPGPFDISYHRYGTRVPASAEKLVDGRETSFFDGIDTSLTGIASLAPGENTAFLVTALKAIHQHVANAYFNYLPSDPGKIAPELADGLADTRQLVSTVQASSLSPIAKADILHELNIKEAQFNTAVAEALGLEVRAYRIPRTMPGVNPALPLTPADTPQWVTPGSDLDVRVHVTSALPWNTGPGLPGSSTLQLTRVWLDNPNGEHWDISRLGSPGMETPANSDADVVFRATVPRKAGFTEPYFTRPNTEQPYYDITDPRWLNLPLAPYPLAGWADFSFNGVPIRVGQVVQTSHREHGVGQISWPLAVVPQLSVNLDSSAGIIPIGTQSWPLTVTVRNDTEDDAAATLHLDLPAGWTDEPSSSPLQLGPGQSQAVTFTVHPSSLADRNYEIHAGAQSGNYTYTQGFTQVGYPGVRPYYLYRPSQYRARGVDVKVAPGIRVGYIMGTGDDVPQALAEIGVHPTLLSDVDLATGNLDQYSTILVGIRAYSSRPSLMAQRRRLLNYVHNGGNLVVQYQSSDFSSAAPFPLTLGSAEKVVEETDPVAILKPDNPLLTTPNRITPADFSGWVEERGHSFLTSWDDRYSNLTETHDPGQDPQLGGLLSARDGKGSYTYVAYALYRQLSEAVPGAFRLLANLVSQQPARQ